MTVYEKMKRKADPRYPLDNANSELGLQQCDLQNGVHKIVIDALNGRFEITVWDRSRDPDSGDLIRNPKSTDMTCLEKYKVRYDSVTVEQDPCIFK